MPFTGKATYSAGAALPEGAEDLSDLVGIISPFETPLLDALGDPQVEAHSTYHEWMEDMPADLRVRRANQTRLFAKRIAIAKLEVAARHLAVVDELDFQKANAVRELLRDLENTIINGLGSSIGIVQEVTTNRFKPDIDGFPSGNDLDKAKLNTALRVVHERSEDVHGQTDLIVANGYQKRIISKFGSVSVYESDFGVKRLVVSRWVPHDAVLLLDSSRISVMPLAGRSFHYQPLAATRDFEKGQVLGEYTLEMRYESAHGVIRGLATE